MAREYFGVLADHRQDAFPRRDQAGKRATIAAIEYWIAEALVHVAYGDNVRAPEIDDGVAVGMGVGHVEHRDLFAIEVKGDVLAERNHGQPIFLIGGELGLQGLNEMDLRESPAGVVMGKDQYTGLAEVFVTAGVISVEMCVDQEPDRLVADCRDRGRDTVGEWRELIVDHEHAVLTREHTDIAALANQHVDLSGDMLRGYFNICQIERHARALDYGLGKGGG